MLSPNSTPSKKDTHQLCIHTHAFCQHAHPSGRKMLAAAQEVMDAVQPHPHLSQPLPPQQCRALKNTLENLAAVERIANLCLQLKNPVIAVCLDHYIHSQNYSACFYFAETKHSLRFHNSLALIGKIEFFQHEWR